MFNISMGYLHFYSFVISLYTKYFTLPDPVAENLLNPNFKVSKPCESMVGDITSIPTKECWDIFPLKWTYIAEESLDFLWIHA